MPKKILAVDDERHIVRLVEVNLQRAGYEVVTAFDGKEGLEKKIGKSRAQKVYKKFEKGGFSTVLIGSIIPPPFPIVPVLMAAGVMQYSRHKFLTALSIGRAVRFFIIAFLCKLYGTAILGWLGRYYKPFLHLLIALGIAGGVALLVYLKWYRPRHRDNREVQTRKAA